MVSSARVNETDLLLFIGHHPRHGHVELVADALTDRGRAAICGDRMITSHIVDTLEDFKRAGIRAMFLPY